MEWDINEKNWRTGKILSGEREMGKKKKNQGQTQGVDQNSPVICYRYSSASVLASAEEASVLRLVLPGAVIRLICIHYKDQAKWEGIPKFVSKSISIVACFTSGLTSAVTLITIYPNNHVLKACAIVTKFLLLWAGESKRERVENSGRK